MVNPPRLCVIAIQRDRLTTGHRILLAQSRIVELAVQTMGGMGRQQLKLPRLRIAMPFVRLQPRRMRRTVRVAKAGDAFAVDHNLPAFGF